LFGGFSAFWSVLALLFEQPRYHLGSDAAGLFGILAVAGVLIAPLAGRHADKGGPARVVRIGAAIVFTAFVIMTVDARLATLAFCVVVMDAGVQMAMIGNQATIYALAGNAPGRYNTVFIATMFLCGAAGSAAATAAWTAAGWASVMLLAAAFAASALLIQFVPRSALESV
jgi:predicted MFS family arabinose efflux permease